jgi:hypothetical protein
MERPFTSVVERQEPLSSLALATKSQLEARLEAQLSPALASPVQQFTLVKAQFV